KIGESGKVVAGKRRRERELPAGQLHSVAAVTGEADHHGVWGWAFGRALGQLGRHVKGPSAALLRASLIQWRVRCAPSHRQSSFSVARNIRIVALASRMSN